MVLAPGGGGIPRASERARHKAGPLKAESYTDLSKFASKVVPFRRLSGKVSKDRCDKAAYRVDGLPVVASAPFVRIRDIPPLIEVGRRLARRE